MDTNLIKTFISLAETKNFNKTAENLYISQPTVSMRIKQLEEEMEKRSELEKVVQDIRDDMHQIDIRRTSLDSLRNHIQPKQEVQ